MIKIALGVMSGRQREGVQGVSDRRAAWGEPVHEEGDRRDPAHV